MSVIFEIFAFNDSRKILCELEIGGTYRGELDESGQRVYYTDQAGVDWVFYVDDTCKLISL